MLRDIPFDKDINCDICDAKGAYDVMGNYYCPDCLFEELNPVNTNADIIEDE